MQKPLTARQAIEVRKAWLDDEWYRKFPKGMWKVIRRQTGFNQGTYPNWKFVTRPIEFFICHYTRRPHQSCSGGVDWWQIPKGQPDTRLQYWKDKGVFYPPTKTNAYKFSEWSFDNKKAAMKKFNEISKGVV